jgi:hypothetical protein
MHCNMAHIADLESEVNSQIDDFVNLTIESLFSIGLIFPYTLTNKKSQYTHYEYITTEN